MCPVIPNVCLLASRSLLGTHRPAECLELWKGVLFCSVSKFQTSMQWHTEANRQIAAFGLQSLSQQASPQHTVAHCDATSVNKEPAAWLAAQVAYCLPDTGTQEQRKCCGSASRLCLTESYSDALVIQALAAPAPAAQAPAAGGGVAVEVMVNCSAVNLLETPVPMDGWCALSSAPQLHHLILAAHAWKPCLQILHCPNPTHTLACHETCTSLTTSARTEATACAAATTLLR